MINNQLPEGNEDYINADYPQDIIDLDYSFRNDILYKLLKRAGLTDKIVTQEMIESLVLGRTYKTEEVALMTGINEPTLRNWLNGRDASQLPAYINAIKETKFHILDAESIYRVRLIFMVQKELKHSIKQISSIATGLEEPYNKSRVVFQPEQMNDVMDKIERLETSNITLNDKCDQLENQNKLLLNFLQSICEKSEDGEFKIKSSALPLLESNHEDIEQIKEKIIQIENDSQQIMQKQIDEHIERINNDISSVKKNMLYRKAENIALERRTFKERLLNKIPDREIVEQIFNELCENND